MTEITLPERRAFRPWRALARMGFGLWPLTAAMAAAALVMAGLWLPVHAVPAVPVRLEWWLLAVFFAVTESAIIHIPVQRDAHTISMSEIPLILGLVFASPPDLLVGRVAGAVLALALYRRQRIEKICFNATLFALEVVTAITVYRAVLGPASPAGPRGWVAALVAAAAAIGVAATLVNIALGLHGNGRPFGETMRAFVAGLLISIGTAFIGALCALIVWYDVRATFVLVGAAGMFFVLIRVYGSLSRRHDDLRAVYTFNSATGASSTVEETISVSLAQTARLLRAERAEVVLAGGNGARPRRVVLCEGAEVAESSTEQATVAALIEVAGRPAPERMHADGTEHPALRPFASGARRRCALVSPLDLVGGSAGAIVVAGRVGPDREFETGDLELLDALASHMALTLGRARMVERLKAEIQAKREIIRSKDQLIASVSHELRTPLTGILGFAETLVEQTDRFTDADRREMLASIAAGALDMSNLVEDLLTAARAQIGALTVNGAPLRLRNLASQVVDHLGAQGIVIAGGEGSAFGDDARVRQILRNLIVNAGRYGGEQVRIDVEDVGVVRVCDDGAGIAAAKRQVIFDPYERAHRTPTQPGSLGLGLSISRTLARLMGGDLTYDYRDGWSVFALRLPATAGEAVSAVSRRAAGRDAPPP